MVKKEDQYKLLLPAISVFNSGFISVFFYANRGVDSFEYQYLILWFYPFLCTLLASFFTLPFCKKDKKFLILLLCIGSLLLYSTLKNLNAKIIEADNITEELKANKDPYGRYLSALNSLKKLKKSTEGQIVITVDKINDHGTSWHELLTLISIVNRINNSASFCIEKDSWWNSYTEKYKCKGLIKKINLTMSTIEPTDSSKKIASTFYILSNGEVRFTYIFSK